MLQLDRLTNQQSYDEVICKTFFLKKKQNLLFVRVNFIKSCCIGKKNFKL